MADRLLDRYLAPDPAKNEDPLDAQIRTQTRQQGVLSLARSTNPDQVAQANRLARVEGLPSSVVQDNLAVFQDNDRMRAWGRVLDNHPQLGGWLANPRNSGVASDDHENIGLLGTIYQGIKDVGSSLRAGAESAGAGLYGVIRAAQETADQYNPIARGERALFGASIEGKIAQFAKNQQDFLSSQADRSRPNVTNYVWRNLLQGIESTPAALSGTALALAGAPAAGVAVVAGTTGGQSYDQARRAGLSSARSALFGAEQGALEYVTEKLPMSRLVGDLANKTPFMRTLVHQLAAELPQEEVATLTQDFTEWATLHPEKPFTDFLKERPSAALETALATIGGAVGNASLAKAVDTTARAAGRMSRRASQAEQATVDSAGLDALAHAAAKSKTRARDPQAFAELLAHLGGDNVENVHIPGDAIASYLQSDMDHDQSFWQGYGDQIRDAVSTGGDVVIPANDAIAHLAGTPAWEALHDDMRLSAGGMSMREAAEFEGGFDQSLADAATSITSDAEREAPRQKLFDNVSRKLMDAGYTPDVARTQAEIVTARAATRAARLGTGLTGSEYDTTEVRQVLPEALAPVVASDGLDMTIAAMRRLRGEAAPTSPSLLEWISKQGGIEDRGGDIASMGGNDWHREKRFRKRLIRATAGDQGSLLGSGEQQNANTPDELAVRAQEAGYFPAGERPTVNHLLDAIGEELRGTPHYAEGSVPDATRAAAEKLIEVLDQEGIDPAQASDADIKALVNRYAQNAAGGGYRQDAETLDQAGRTPRGQVNFEADRTVISLFEKRDLSTFIHETGHIWAEELRADAAADDAPASVRADWEAVKNWFASNGHPINDDGSIPVEAHELWARGVERYVMEGKSPSPALRQAFSAFRSWLLNIYRAVQNLRSPITPEIRGVMDRLVATDEEITAASEEQRVKALFDTAASAGMTDQEFASYRGSVDAVRSEAFDALLFRTMSAVRASRTAEYRDQRESLRRQAAEDVDARPEWRAMAMLRDKTNDIRLDRQWLLDTYGADALDLMPKAVPPIYTENGTDAGFIAEMSGFQTADDMARTLMGIEARRRQMRAAGDKRSVRESVIDDETDAVLRDRHGDPLGDGTIEREARELIHNDRQGEVIAAELRALSRRARRASDPNQTPTPYALAKQWAADKVRSGTVQEYTSRGAVERFRRAARQAATHAEQAILASDVDEAFRQKQRQMLNNALVSEASTAADEVGAAVKRLGKVAKRATMKSIDQDYLEQAQALLEAVDLRERSQVSINRQGSFEKWAREREAEGFDVVMPPSFEATLGTTNWTRLTVDTLLGLDATITQIMHLGRLKQTLIDDKARRDYDDARGDVLSAIGTLRPLPPKPNIDTRFGKVKEVIVGAHAGLTKMGRMIDVLDNGDPNGPLNRYVWRPLAEARHRENDMMSEVDQKRRESLALVPGAIKRTFADRVNIPELPGPNGDTTWTRMQLHQIARNAGAAENWRVLCEGRGWNQANALAALDRILTKEEWEYVQRDLDHINSFWPQIAAQYRRINGVAPPKIEARPIVTSHGTFDGGYYPLVADTTANPVLEGAMRSDDLFDTLYTRATPRNGFTVERTGATYIVNLSPSVSHQHITGVVHDLTHREALMQADKFMSDPRIVTAIRGAIGLEMQRQFRPWLKHIANSVAFNQFGTGALEAVANKARTSMSIMGMGFRISTMLQQVAGYANSVEALGRNGEAWMLSGARSVAGMGLKGSFDFAAERSGVVRHRIEQLDLTQEQELAKLAGKRGLAADARRFAFYGIGLMDRAVIVPTWHAGYNKGIGEGMSEEDAIALADKVVESSQGGGGAMNTSAIQRQQGLSSLLVMFYSYGAAYYNRQAQLARDWGDAARERRVRDVPRLLARTWWLMFAPNMISAMIQLAMGGGPDDDESYAGWLAWQSVSGMFAGVPVAGSLVKSAASGFDFQASPLDSAGSTALNTAKDVWHSIDDYVPAALPGADPYGETKASKRVVRNVVETAGYATSLPLGQPAPAVQFLADWANGKAHPETAHDWFVGLSKGKLDEQHH